MVPSFLFYCMVALNIRQLRKTVLNPLLRVVTNELGSIVTGLYPGLDVGNATITLSLPCQLRYVIYDDHHVLPVATGSCTHL